MTSVNESTKIEITPGAIQAFNVLKEELIIPSILGYADCTLPFELHKLEFLVLKWAVCEKHHDYLWNWTRDED